MKFIVCVKQVPDADKVEMDEETGTIIREGVPTILNPFDEFALNEAIRWREKIEGEIIVISMGPPQVEDTLQKCLAIGADRAIKLSDVDFAGSDTWATALTLVTAVEEINDYDIIFCGQQAIDGDTAQVGPEMANLLNIPHFTYVEEIEELDDEKLVVRKEVDRGYQCLQQKLPVLVACMPRSDFEPRIPGVKEIMKARKKTMESWQRGDLKLKEEEVGLDGSPTQVINIYPPPQTGDSVKIDTAPDKAAEEICSFLQSEGVS